MREDNDSDNDNDNFIVIKASDGDDDDDYNNNKDNENENDINYNKSKLIYKYFTAILDFENKIEKLYTNYNWVETNKAFIINLKDYQEFKDSIFYDVLKENNNNEKTCKKKINELIEDDKIDIIKKIDKVIIRTKRELKELIREKK